MLLSYFDITKLSIFFNIQNFFANSLYFFLENLVIRVDSFEFVKNHLADRPSGKHNSEGNNALQDSKAGNENVKADGHK